MMHGVRASLRRIGLIAQNTLREAARQKAHYFFLLVAVALVVGARWLGDFNFGAPETKFLADCGLGAMAFFGAALAISATAQLFFAEIENRSVLTLLAKPVGRSEFLLGKFLGAALLVAAFCIVVAAVLGAVIGLRERELARSWPDAMPPAAAMSYANLALATLLQWLKLTVLAALTLLIASYARTQLFTTVSAFLVLVIGHAQHLAHATYARAEAGWMRALAALFSWVFPNFQVFSVADSLAALDAPAAGDVLRVAIYAAIYVAAANGLAIFSFNRREI